VVGDLIGSGEAQERGIVGETPNLAARLQGIAEPNTVVIAESTRKLLGNLFDVEDLGGQDLKGVAGPVRAWTALRPSGVESRFEALRTATTPLVGREEEVDLLLRRWEQAKEGDGSVVLISGEPGIGKSRIAETIVARVVGEPHTRLRYFCSPHHQDSALYPSIAQLERAAGFRREELLSSLPDDTGRRQRELDLQIALGQALIAIQGYSAPEVGQTYARARQLCEQLDWPPQLVPVLNGQCAYQMCVPEDLARALPYADELLALGEARNAKGIQRAGHNLRGMVHLWLGNFLAARKDFEQSLQIQTPARRASSHVLAAEDPRVAALINLSTALSYLGYADQARQRDADALAEANNLGHAYQRAYASGCTSAIGPFSQ
jgi:tetratricopeptide (TPR) repeat protein